MFKSKKRLSMDKELFALRFDPVLNVDRGKYSCLVNGRAVPEAAIKLNVLGKRKAPYSLYLVCRTQRYSEEELLM